MISENNLSFLSLGLDFFNFNRRCSSKATHLFAYKDNVSYLWDSIPIWIQTYSSK